MTSRRTELLLTGALTAAAVIAGATHRHDRQRFSKPIIVPSLLAGALARSRRRRSALVVAGAGATVGDWFMLRYDERCLVAGQTDAHRFLRLGAAGFTVQQIGYSALLAGAGARVRPRVAVPVLAVLLGLAAVDSAGQDGPDPVLVGYGLTLAAMVSLGIDAGGPARAGAALFFASDSAIMLSGRLSPGSAGRRAGEAFVLLTYAAAQALLLGALAGTE
ncbi:lysoplasmalogenase family protein [Pseudonocardia spinosispora]|uniref:lysoplasmalogenase family protein n=1 Tax=Pseudonocardia spinosispora TaxID=103441 RepID=UPI00040ECE93|nr:lysoplasmalogenase family protein [Pseudonocardia spinosispora]